MKWNKSEEKTYWLPNHQAMFAYMASCLLLSPGAGLLGPWKDSRGFLLEPVRSQEFKDRNCSLWPSGGAQSLIWPSKSLIHEVPFVVVLPQQLVACTPSHEITSCFAEGQWENCLGSLIQSHKLSKPKKLRKKKKKRQQELHGKKGRAHQEWECLAATWLPSPKVGSTTSGSWPVWECRRSLGEKA